MLMCELKVVAFSYRRECAEITLLAGPLFLHERECAEITLLGGRLFLHERESAEMSLLECEVSFET